MNWKKSRTVKIISGLPLCLSLLCASSASFGADTSAAGSTYKTLDYRMVFSELALEQYGEGTRALHPLVVDKRISDMYKQLFTGTDASKRIMFDATGTGNTGLKFIKDVNPATSSNDIRSEGVSYGMMIAVMMDDKPTFDALWGFARKFMYNDKDGGKWYAWSLADTPPNYPMNRDGTKYGQNPAPDGEEYFAMALFFADHRWGSSTGTGNSNYKYWANDTLALLGNTSGTALWDATNNMVKFSPYETFTDPSYHVPAFYELWGQWADTGNANWSAAATKSRTFFKAAVDAGQTGRTTTGLFSEYASFAGAPQATTYNALSQHSAYDAYRVIQNIAIDHYWWSKDTNMKSLVEGIMNFYDSDRELSTPVGNLAKFQYTGIYGLGVGSTLYMTPPNRGTAPVPGLAAMNAVGAVASDQPYASKFVQYLWDQPTPTGDYRYYDGMLQMLAYLHLSGYYRVYAANEGASADLSMSTSRQDAAGNPIIYYGAPAYFTVAGCKQGETEGAFSWRMDFLQDTPEIAGNPDFTPLTNQTFTKLSNGRYFAEIPTLAPKHGPYSIGVTRTCNGVTLPVETTNGYVDPSGLVRTTRGYPVAGATVTLFQTATNDAASLLSQLPNGSTQMAPYNRKNPDKTDATGRFGWDVTAGHWYKVTASHPECVSPTDPLQQIVSTALMFIPPEVTNLDIRLDCPGNRMAVSVTPYSDSGTRYCADVVIRNNNSTSVKWNVKFNVDGTIDSYQNANLSQSSRTVTATGLSGNNVLAPFTSTQGISFCATRNRVLTTYPIIVRARGTSGAENINLTVGGVVVASWNLTTSFKDYTVMTQLGGGINVVYTNDNGVANRDVVVDYVDIANVRKQTEAQAQNTSVFGNGRCGGGSLSEWMHCSGWVGFPAYK